jgi:hypothetical protein
MTKSQVCTGLRNDIKQPGRITQHTSHPTSQTVFCSPALQRGQGVWTGVDHGDVVSQLCDADGRPTGAATEVNDLDRPVRFGGLDLECRQQGIPHHRGADDAARVWGAAGHASPLPAGRLSGDHPSEPVGVISPNFLDWSATACGVRSWCLRRPA